jgi:signal transduction histidine kinase
VDVFSSSRRSYALDALVALALTGGILAVTAKIASDQHDGRGLDVLGYAAIVVAGGALAWRRRWPVAVVAAVTLALVVYSVRDYPGGPVFVTSWVAIYTVATTSERRRSVPLAVAATVAIFVPGRLGGTGSELGAMHLLFASWAAVAVFLGEAVRSRRAYLAGLEERARYLEETREEEARRRVVEERLRIARDLHDVVAHSIASINVQSGAAAHVIDRHPEQAREALLAIKQTSKTALGELRATLGLLRQGGGEEAAPRGPAPSLAQLDTLVDTAARGGLPVDVSVRGDARPLPPAVDLAAYRIVQESLTNVVRHAGPATATVSVAYGPASVEIEVVDDGRGPNGAWHAYHIGHGIVGIRERAAAVGGRVEVGPRPGGGFRVWARLPDDAAAG